MAPCIRAPRAHPITVLHTPAHDRDQNDHVAVDIPQILICPARRMPKTMSFWSDGPTIAPENWPDAFDKAACKDKVRPLILKDNAPRLLGVPNA